MGQGAVPELMQCRAAGGLGEQRRGMLIAQPRPAGRVKVGRGQLHTRLPLGQEHRPGLAALEQPRQEPGRRRSRWIRAVGQPDLGPGPPVARCAKIRR
jgi:hypothetical protein